MPALPSPLNAGGEGTLSGANAIRNVALDAVFSVFERYTPAPSPAARTPTEILKPLSRLIRRQSTIVAVPNTYEGLNGGPSPGTVVGIVLGSVAAFILLFWL